MQVEIASRNSGIFQTGATTIAAAFAQPVQQAFAVVQDLAKQWSVFASQAEAIVANIQRSVANTSSQLLEIAAAASKKFHEVLKRSEDIAKLGWTFPSKFDFSELVQLSEIDNKADADVYVLKWYEENDQNLEDLEKRLMRNRQLASFKTLLPQCFSAIRRAEYAIAIPSLLAILNEVLIQLNPPHLHASTDVKKTLRTKGKVAQQAKRDVVTAAIWLSLMTFCNDLYAQSPLVGSLDTSPVLRHAIQHGRKEPPNEKVDAIRLLHALDTALSLHEDIKFPILSRS
jgi:hypothetical protein